MVVLNAVCPRGSVTCLCEFHFDFVCSGGSIQEGGLLVVRKGPAAAVKEGPGFTKLFHGRRAAAVGGLKKSLCLGSCT